MSTPTSINLGAGQSDTTVKPGRSAEDINDFLSQDIETDKKPIKEDNEEEQEEEEEVKKPKKELSDDDEDDEDVELSDEDEEDEDEDSDEDEKKLKLKKDTEEDDELEIDAPPRKKEILKAFPELFKKFPWMEKMMYRDRQYTELFGSFDDAKEASERVAELEAFEQDLSRGSTEKVLARIKEVDKAAFDRIVDNYLPTLAKVDIEAYREVAGNIGKQIISDLANEAQARLGAGDKDTANTLRLMASNLNQFLFNTTKFEAPKPRSQGQSEEELRLERERLEFVQERFTTVRNDMQAKVDKVLRATIADYIDPKGEMSSYEKRNATQDALRNLHMSIREDRNFMKMFDKLWDSAFADKFSQASQDRIRKAYLGKSRNGLKKAILDARKEALKDRAPRARKASDEDESEDKETREERRPRRQLDTGRPRQSGGNSKLERKKGESVTEFFARD